MRQTGGKRGEAAAEGPPSLIGEFIGRKLVVLESSTESLRGAEGKVVDETKNTFVIEVHGRERRIPKKGCVFGIAGKRVRGGEIMFRAEDRPRKLKRKLR
jgi:RNase P/RNase MRP subunit p29